MIQHHVPLPLQRFRRGHFSPRRPAHPGDEFNPTAQTLANQLQDWIRLDRYPAHNEKLKSEAPKAGGQTAPQMLARMFEDVIKSKVGRGHRLLLHARKRLWTRRMTDGTRSASTSPL